MNKEETKWPFKRMLSSHLAVRIDDFKYSGRLVIPEVAKHLPTKGIVVAIADDITDIKINDKILYSQFAGYLLRFEDVPLLRILSYSEVLAILNDDAPELSKEGV